MNHQHTHPCLLNIAWVFSVVKTLEPKMETLGSDGLLYVIKYKVRS